MLTKLRDAIADRATESLTRIASALERIAAAQEEQVQLSRLQRTGGTGFYTGYVGADEGSVLNQPDEEFAKWEEIEARQQRGEHVDPSEEPR